MAPPCGRTRRTRASSLDPWRDRIEQWLREDRKLTAKRIRRLLLPLAGAVSPRSVRRYVAALRRTVTSKVTDEAIGAIVGGYTREAGVWLLAAVLDEVCAKVVRRRAEGDTAAVVVTPEKLAGMLGAPRHPAAEVAGRTGRPGVPSDCAARRAALARRRSSKRAGWPAPGR